jgi:hypothetical protein
MYIHVYFFFVRLVFFFRFKYILFMTISYHMQNLMLCTFILTLHHIQINVIPKYMLHVGIVKSMYLRREKKDFHYGTKWQVRNGYGTK